MKNLVIVESPAKAKTIEGFLGKDFKVLASYGHVRDLPKTKLGVDVEDNFEPHYIIPVKAKPTIKALKEAAKGAAIAAGLNTVKLMYTDAWPKIKLLISPKGE